MGGSAAKYEKLRLLGSGAFGEAWLVKSFASGRLYVTKELRMKADLTASQKDTTQSEVQIIKSCCHVNIIKYKECFISHVSSSGIPILSIVMEYADAGDLHDFIKRQKDTKKAYLNEVRSTSLVPKIHCHVIKSLTPSSFQYQIRNWLVQIAFALEYLHKHSILHRDLKTHNIFMTSSRLLKLGDFGISRTLRSAAGHKLSS